MTKGILKTNEGFEAESVANAMQAIAQVLDGVLNKDITDNQIGFVLLTFQKDGETGSRTNYVSNCQREDILAALKEVVGRFEGQPHQEGRA